MESRQRPTEQAASHVERNTEFRAPKRHEDLWFSDGSVVLATDTTLFRVHISILSRHSAFFCDMFSLPQPSLFAGASSVVESAGDIGDCPFVHLQDSAEDLANLLKALYDGP